MKKIFLLSLLIIFQLISLGSFAQQLTDEWRLLKKTWLHPGEGKMEWIYSYDATGKITNIKYYQGKKLHSIQAGFVYDNQSRISSYMESLTSGADTIEHHFSYDDKNRLFSIKEKEFNKGNILTRTFRYAKNKIEESKSFKSQKYGEYGVGEITYGLDGNENIARKTTIEDGKKIAEAENIYIYGEYDNKPNPMIFTGAYFYTLLESKQNGKEGYFASDLEKEYKPAKTIFAYTPSGMLLNAAVTYILDNRGYTHQYTYTYAKIKSASKPVLK